MEPINYTEVPYKVPDRPHQRHVNAEGVWVIGNYCLHCNDEIGPNDMTLALVYPHMGHLHEWCVPIYSYARKWQHPFPLQHYSQDDS